MILNTLKSGFATLVLFLLIFPVVLAQNTFNAKTVFDSMYNEMKYHYPIFKERKINWEEKYNQYNSLIDASTSEDSLFSILVEMYGPINDFHIVLGSHNGHYKLRTWGWGRPKFYERFKNDSLRKAFWNIAFKTLYRNDFGPIKTYGDIMEDRPLFHYSSSPTYAYLNITRCYLSELDSFSNTDQEALQKFMDSFLVSILHKKALIIDLRASHNGHDEFAYMIASRFTDKKFQANFSHIFKTNIFDSIEVKHFVEPKGNFQFTKPIIVLTNDGTRSAADVFALTMKQLPHVIIIGENTFGSFGESIYKDIGNGWYINYPIEKFYSPQGQCYEGTGVPVDFKIENSTHDIISRIDNVIVSAISLINK